MDTINKDVQGTTPEFQAYLEGIRNKMKAYFEANKFTMPLPFIDFEAGPKYIRVVKVEQNGKSVHTFVERSTGNVLKANGYKSPCKKNPRSNIFNADNGLSGVSQFGAVYLK